MRGYFNVAGIALHQRREGAAWGVISNEVGYMYPSPLEGSNSGNKMQLSGFNVKAQAMTKLDPGMSSVISGAHLILHPHIWLLGAQQKP